MIKSDDATRMTWLPQALRPYPLKTALLIAVAVFSLSPPAWSQASDAASAPEAAASLPVPAPTPVFQPLPSTPPQLAAPTTLLPPPQWAALTRTQKTALTPLERDWDTLDPARKSKWLEIVPRFAALPAEEQARIHERMRAWASLSPAERQQARIGYQVAQQVKAGDRQAKWEAYQALPPEKRRELADKAVQKLSKPPIKPDAERSLAKSNLVPAAPKGLPAKPVAPSVLQAKPGASTVLITQVKTVPTHQQAGQTKVFADPDLVDSKTLLPKRLAAAPTSSH